MPRLQQQKQQQQQQQQPFLPPDLPMLTRLTAASPVFDAAPAGHLACSCLVRPCVQAFISGAVVDTGTASE